MELEDSYGIKVSEEQASRIETVGDAVDFVVERLPGVGPWRAASAGSVGEAGVAEPSGRRRPQVPRSCAGCSTRCRSPCAARRSRTPRGSSTEPTPTVVSPSSATASSASRSPSTCSAPYPRADIGRLTKMHGQAVSGRACAEVAVELGVPQLLEESAPRRIEGGIEVAALLASERALASVCEAVIGAAYLHHGFEVTATATVAAFRQEIEIAAERLLDFKSALQERLAREGARVSYEVTSEDGPPHDRVFEVAASVSGEIVGYGSGRSKKAAEQAAAEEALAESRRLSHGRRKHVRTAREATRGRLEDMHLSSITIKGFKSFPERTKLVFSPGVSVIVGPNGCGKSNVTDAVLWALGEQSPLSVRGQTMQDMIYAGGEGLGPSRYAEVEVVLDNRTAPREAAGVLRARDRAAARARGEGTYRLNGARARLADVIEVLADANLGREMHSVISQGRVRRSCSRPRASAGCWSRRPPGSASTASAAAAPS